MSDFELKPKHVTTPLGAVVGLIATRKLLGKNQRTVANQLLGAGIGAGAGYIGGEFLESDPLNIHISGKAKPDQRTYSSFVRRSGGLKGDPSKTELDLFSSAYPDPEKGKYISDASWAAMSDDLKKIRLFRARGVILERHAANLPPEQATPFLEAAAANRQEADKYQQNLPSNIQLGGSLLFENLIKKPIKAIGRQFK